jgi:hypothetical protein
MFCVEPTLCALSSKKKRHFSWIFCVELKERSHWEEVETTIWLTTHRWETKKNWCIIEFFTLHKYVNVVCNVLCNKNKFFWQNQLFIWRSFITHYTTISRAHRSAKHMWHYWWYSHLISWNAKIKGTLL